jgi:hypothetical protein
MKLGRIAAITFIVFSALIALPGLRAQDIEDLNIQIHGYTTQGFIYTTQNNWNTTQSSDGSAAWTESVMNVSAVPIPKLRLGVQPRYFLLGTTFNTITLDWAQADYKVNEKFGARVGKVKTPTGLLNEVQDIDPAQLWVLLPQSVYAITSRNSVLSHYGGVVYGTFNLGEKMGKLEYDAWAGQRILSGNDGIYLALRDRGINLPNGSTGPMYGETLIWHLPLQGVTVGGSLDHEHVAGQVQTATTTGSYEPGPFYQPYIFAKYEYNKVMLAGEYTRQSLSKTITYVGAPTTQSQKDQRSFYVMGSYRVSEKTTAGMYYSSTIDRGMPVSAARYQKDWAITVRHDFNTYLYAKVEQHFMDGTYLGFDTSDNTGGLLPDTRMTLLKFGVSF